MNGLSATGEGRRFRSSEKFRLPLPGLSRRRHRRKHPIGACKRQRPRGDARVNRIVFCRRDTSMPWTSGTSGFLDNRYRSGPKREKFYLGPLGGGCIFPIQNCISPIQNCIFPFRKRTFPIRDRNFPIQKSIKPFQKPRKPLQKCIFPFPDLEKPLQG